MAIAMASPGIMAMHATHCRIQWIVKPVFRMFQRRPMTPKGKTRTNALVRRMVWTRMNLW